MFKQIFKLKIVKYKKDFSKINYLYIFNVKVAYFHVHDLIIIQNNLIINIILYFVHIY